MDPIYDSQINKAPSSTIGMMTRELLDEEYEE
jgi:hypothetical protein